MAPQAQQGQSDQRDPEKALGRSTSLSAAQTLKSNRHLRGHLDRYAGPKHLSATASS